MLSTTTVTIQQLQLIFSRFGLPETLVSDNGAQFSSEEFQSYCRVNGSYPPYLSHTIPSIKWRSLLKAFLE